MKKTSNLSRYREEIGLSQTELARKMNVTQQCISSWQTGRTIPKPYQMKMLSEILSVSINELFSEVFNKAMQFGNKKLHDFRRERHVLQEMW